MVRYTLGRLAQLIPVLILASIVVWLMIYLVPGDPVLLRLGPDATPEQIEAEREARGFDRPLVVQYLYWLRDAVQGDLGRSIANGESVTTLIMDSFPVTFSLTVFGLIVAILIGMPMGIVAALRPKGIAIRFLNLYTSLALALPTFWVGMILVWVFAIHFEILPSSGYVSFRESPVDFFRSMLLPAITLGFYGSGIIARFVAASMSEVLTREYLWTARAKGISERAVVARHGFRNALVPVVTILGLQFGLLLGGAVVIEGVFNLPGMGRLLLDAVSRRDYAIVQAEMLFILIAVAVINIFVDVMYGVLDPRIRVR